MNLGDLHQVWEIKEWSDQLGIWAMPASHHSTGAVLALHRVLRGMRVYALWVLAGCFLCLYGQDLRSFTFLLDRQVLEALDVLKKKPEAQAEEVFPIEKLIAEAYSVIDKAVKVGTLHRNTGARRKSRLARRKRVVEIHHGWYTPAPAAPAEASV